MRIEGQGVAPLSGLFFVTKERVALGKGMLLSAVRAVAALQLHKK